MQWGWLGHGTPGGAGLGLNSGGVAPPVPRAAPRCPTGGGVWAVPQQQQRKRQGFPWNAEPPVPVLSPRSVAVQGDELAGITHTALGTAPKINPASAGASGTWGWLSPALAPHLCLSPKEIQGWCSGTRPFPRRKTQLCSARGSCRAEESMEPTAPHHPVPAPEGITAAPGMPWEPQLHPTETRQPRYSPREQLPLLQAGPDFNQNLSRSNKGVAAPWLLIQV